MQCSSSFTNVSLLLVVVFFSSLKERSVTFLRILDIHICSHLNAHLCFVGLSSHGRMDEILIQRGENFLGATFVWNLSNDSNIVGLLEVFYHDICSSFLLV